MKCGILQVIDNIIVIKKGIQSLIHKFFKYFQYLMTERLDDSGYYLILNLS